MSNKNKNHKLVKVSDYTHQLLIEWQKETNQTFDSIIQSALLQTVNTNRVDIIMDEFNNFLSRIYRYTSPQQQRNFENIRPLIRKLAMNDRDYADEIQRIFEILKKRGNNENKKCKKK